MNNNLHYIQLQIKAFNKALARADKAGKLSNEAYEQITDLIDYDRMTQGGYGKAGTKYLESLSPEELLAYSSDIQAAKDIIELETLESRIDIEGAKDSKSLLWRMYQKLEDMGLPFDSDVVKMVAEGESKKVNYKSLALKMAKYMHDKNYGLSDVQKWFDETEGI